MKTAQLTTKDKDSKANWEMHVRANQDDYGWGVIEAAARLGAALDKGLACDKAEEEAVKNSGMTGFMAGAMAQIVAQLHPRGEEFNQYWNNKFGVEDTDGTVNPAIMTISKK